jgi:hypothetical protein
MSDSNTLNIGGQDFTLDLRKIDAHKRVDDPAKPGKKMLVPAPIEIVCPVLTTNDEWARLFGALLTGADAIEAGNGVKLAEALCLEHLKDASTGSFDLTKGVENPDRYVQLLLSPTRPRSSGPTLVEMFKQSSELGIEMGVLGAKAVSADGWRELTHPDGSPMFDSQAKFILRLDELSRKISDLGASIEARQAAIEKQQKARDEKKQAAEAAAKAVTK